MAKGIDDLDRRIIKVLQKDARLPFTHIASELNEPDTTIHFRTRKLLEKKVVNRFAALIRPEALGYHVAALFKIEIGGHILPDISKERTLTYAEELSERETSLLVAIEPPHTIHAIIMGASVEDLQQVREEIEKSPDVTNTTIAPLSKVVKGWELSGNPD